MGYQRAAALCILRYEDGWRERGTAAASFTEKFCVPDDSKIDDHVPKFAKRLLSRNECVPATSNTTWLDARK